MARHASSRIDRLLVGSSFDGEVLEREPLARHTSYRIGGFARYYVRADSLNALTQLIGACDETEIPWVVIGKGTNLLVADEGYPGAVITLGRDFRNHRFDEETRILSSGAGVSLSTIVQEAFHRSLAGLEFAVGTPGSVGGAIRMNAGTAETYLASTLVSVTTMHPRFGLRRLLPSEITWGYRTSSFDPHEVILEAEVALSPADPFYIRGKMEGSLAKRRKSQPLNMPSCGSVFKNPAGHSAGALIDQLGLKGLRIGDAQVSDVHANFIVNVGAATARDVRAVIEHVQRAVFEAYGIRLETEVRFLGF